MTGWCNSKGTSQNDPPQSTSAWADTATNRSRRVGLLRSAFLGTSFSVVLLGLVLGAGTINAQQLNEHCMINLLNYTVQVHPDGTWALPNIPIEPGYYRLRVVCTENGETIGGMSDFFTLTGDGPVDYGQITFGNIQPPPEKLLVGVPNPNLTIVGQTTELIVLAKLPSGEFLSAASALAGTLFTSSNPEVATVNADGVVTAVSNGVVLIQVRNEGATATVEVEVKIPEDDDLDGIPNDYELAAGLNPNDPGDASVDFDEDGLTTFDEYVRGTNPLMWDTDGDTLGDGDEVSIHLTDPLLPDTDNDTLIDGKELVLGINPLHFDTDGDGIRDGIEILMGTNPKIKNPTTTLTGTVLDSQGAAVPGAAVIVYDTLVTNTDAQGNFSMPFVPKLGSKKSVAVARMVTDGEVREGTSIVFNAVIGGVTPLGTIVIKILPESVAGTVLSPSGKLVPGANVTLFAGSAVKATVTNLLGQYLFKQVPPGPLTLQSIDSKTGLRAQVFNTLEEGGTVTQSIKLSPNGTIIGKVLDVDGQTLVGPDVAIQITGPQAGSLATDVFSEYRFGYMPLGVYTVDAIAADGKRGRTVANLNSTNQVFKANLTYLGQGQVAGFVETAAGQKVAGAQVTLTSQSVFGGTKSTITAPDGSFALDNVYVGGFQLSAYSAVLGLGGIAAGTIDFDGDLQLTNITLTASATLSGTVYQSNGNTPVSGAKIILTPSGKTATTDALGGYSFVGIPLGTYTMDTSDPATGDKAKTTANVLVPDATTTVDVILNGVGTVNVVVQTASNVPVANAKVTLTSTTAFGGTKQGFTDASGLISFANVIAGTFTVTAADPAALLGGSVSSSVLPGETAQVTVKLEAAATLQGTIFLADGQTIATNVTVKLSPTDKVSITGTDGKYVFDNIPVAKSPYTIKVYDASGTLRAAKFGVNLSFHGQVATHDITMSGAGTVQGEVFGPDGMPVSGATVTVTSVVEGSKKSTTTTGLSGQYIVGNLPVGNFTVTVSKSSEFLAGSASGTILYDKHIAIVNVAMQANQIPPPPPPPPGGGGTTPQPGSGTLATLFDANNFAYTVRQGGFIADGKENIFQGDNAQNRGALRLVVSHNGTETKFVGTGASLEMGGRQLAIPGPGPAGLEITRRVYTPHDGYFTRFVDEIHNPTDSPITVTLRHESTYRNRTQVIGAFTFTFGMGITATSNGDSFLGTTGHDHWMTADDVVDADPFLQTNNLPAIAHVFDGPDAGLQVDTYAYKVDFTAEARAQLETSYSDVVVPAGQSVMFMQFLVQTTSRDGANMAAARLVQLPPEALFGLTQAEMDNIANFTVPANGVSEVEALPERNGKIDGEVFEGDQITPVPNPKIRFQSDNPLFGRTWFYTADAQGKFVISSVFNNSGSSIPVPRGPFTVEATHPISNELSGETGGDFFVPDSENTGVAIFFSGTGIINGLVKRPDGTVVSIGTATVSGIELAKPVTVNIAPDGSYAFYGLPPGSYTVTVNMPVPQGTGLTGFASTMVTAGAVSVVNITIEAAGTALGTVYQGGVPLPLVVVKITAPGFSRQTTTDTGGGYVFIDMPLGEFTVTAVEPKTKLPSNATVSIFDSQETIQDLSVIGLGSVEVEATFGDGTVVANGNVQIQKTPLGTAFASAGKTNFFGKLLILDVPEGAFSVRVFHPTNASIFATVSGSIAAHGELVSVPVQLALDEAPTVSLTSPPDGTGVLNGAKITATATASDDLGVTKVEFLIDGKLAATDPSAPYSSVITILKPTIGTTVFLQARATDTGGNTALSAPVGITVLPDEAEPTVILSAPVPGATFIEGKSFAVNATASDNVGVTKVEFTANGQLFATDLTAPYSANFNIPSNYTVGANLPLSIEATAYDQAGNVGQAIVSVVVTPDAPPTITLTSAPTSGSTVIEGTQVVFKSTATDDIGVTVSLLVNGNSVQTRFQPPFDFTYTLPQVELVTNPLSITLVATDTKGQKASTAATELTVIHDEPPTIAITTPADGSSATEGASLNVAASASDDLGVVQVEFFLAGASLGVDKLAPFTVAGQVPAGTDGDPLEIKAVATDTIGQKTTATITVFREDDTTAPSVATITLPANGAIIPTGPADIMFVIDASSSAAASLGADIDGDGTNDNALKAAILSAKELLNYIDTTTTKVGVVEIKSAVTIKQPLTHDKTTVVNALNNMLSSGTGGTANWSNGIKSATDSLVGGNARRGAQPVQFFMSAGSSTYPTTEAQRAQDGAIVIHTFGVGPTPNQSLLQQLATQTEGAYTGLTGPAQIVDIVPTLSGVGLDSLGVTVDAADDIAVQKVTIHVQSADSTIDETVVDTKAPYTALVSLSGLTSEKSVTVNAQVDDFGGNSTAATPVQITVLPATKPPVISSVSPNFGAPGDSIVIKGKFFHPVAALNSVSFGGAIGIVTAGNKLQLTVTVPEGGSTGDLTVTADGLTSNGIPFGFDTDGDGLLDLDELDLGTDPNLPDTDDDGLTDFAEVMTHGTNPLNVDSDGDGLFDGWEIQWNFDPLVGGEEDDDNDSDELDNLGEQAAGTNPHVPDTDNDGLTDGSEVSTHGTNPLLVDTDGDGLTDKFEVDFGLDPLNGGDESLDPDADDLDNLTEQAIGTDPTNPDTDGDALFDGAEVNVYGTDPLDTDSDADGLEDGDEVVNLGTNPALADSDEDGLDDGIELNVHLTNPTLPDTDGDQLSDGAEVLVFTTNPLATDTDGDGLADGVEVLTYGTSPKATDSDADTYTDGDEVNVYGTDPNVPNICKMPSCDGDTCVLVDTDAIYCCEVKTYNQGFNTNVSAGYGFSGTSMASKWQVFSGGKSASAPGSLYYGNIGTKNFNDGISSGQVTSPLLPVPDRDGAELSFMLYMATDSGATTDTLVLDVLDGATTTTVWTKAQYTTFSQWKKQTVSMAAFAGKTIQLRWTFNTVTANNNSGEGVYIDDIQLDTPCPPPPCFSDAECEDNNACTTDVCAFAAGCVNTPVVCSDGNVCTTDSCNPATGCVFTNNTLVCDDGNPCTNNDKCAGGNCGGSAVNCNDNNVCTADSCNPATGCVHTPAAGACNDGNACTNNDTCNEGTCGGTPITCVDGNICTNDGCNPATGCVFTNNTATCDDNSLCTTNDQCSGGVCGGTAVICNDNDACTQDSCGAGTGCVFTDITASCDDQNTCTADSCDTLAGCINTPIPGSCDDANACTEDDTCDNGLCVGSGITCNDGNQCTVDSCHPLVGCVFGGTDFTEDFESGASGWTTTVLSGANTWTLQNTSAGLTPASFPSTAFGVTNNGDAAGNEHSALVSPAFNLTGGGELKFDSFVANENPPFDTETVEVSYNGGTSWEVLVGSTDAGWLNQSTWTTFTVAVPANKGSVNTRFRFVFNTVDACCGDPTVIGWFVDTVQITSFGGNLDCDDNNACTTDSCDPAEGCVHTAIVCNDGNGCTNDTCASATGCVYTPNTTACNDNNACTSADVCAAGTCKGTAISCNDSDSCTEDSCDPSSGCVNTFKTCDDSNSCTDDGCDPIGGCVHANNTIPCDDGSVCTTNDVCSAGNCGGTTLSCSDGDGCTVDSCDPITGCHHVAVDCDDGNVCTLDSCAGGQCQYEPSFDPADLAMAYNENFGTGIDAAGFTFAGASSGSKWQVFAGGKSVSAPGSLYYGNTAKLSFDDGANQGTATSPPIMLVDALGNELAFWLYMDTESGTTWDTLTLEAVVGNTATVIWTKAQYEAGGAYKVWRKQTVNLDAFQGQTIALRFVFNTVDGVANTGEGVYIDDISVQVPCAALDADNDGLADVWEAIYNTNPALPDTDGDGLLDGFEVEYGFNPLAGGDQTGDPDNDGLNNLGEQTAQTNPLVDDTDGDGLVDGDEVLTYGTDPLQEDTDSDLLSDGVEVNDILSDPTNADTDNGGRTDGEEVLLDGTDPLNGADDAICGNSICNLTENCVLCPDDCGPCGDCTDPTCDDGTKTTYVGGPSTSACSQHSGDKIACESAYHQGNKGVYACFYDDVTDDCRGCGPYNANAGNCIDSCGDIAECPGDATRTTYVGGPYGQVCQMFDNNQTGCETAFHHGWEGKPTSCFFDADTGACRGCGAYNQNVGACTNTCAVTPACVGDAARTDYLGGPTGSTCHLHDGDAVGCAMGYATTTHNGLPQISSCTYDATTGTCSACGYSAELSGMCVNTCSPLCLLP